MKWLSVVLLFVLIGCGVNEDTPIDDYVSPFGRENVKTINPTGGPYTEYEIMPYGYYDLAPLNGGDIYTLGLFLGDKWNTLIYGSDQASIQSPTEESASTKSETISTDNVDDSEAMNLYLRDSENEMLSSGYPQNNKQIMRSAPIDATVGTEWKDVRVIAHNNLIIWINTICIRESAHALYFVNNIDKDKDFIELHIDEMVTAFENTYTMMQTKFGSENDTDGNGKVIVLFTSAMPYIGYFWSIDKYSQSYNGNSNEADIIYITADWSFVSDINNAKNTIKACMAHEFQHMIYFDEHYNRGIEYTEIWLNEALSQAAEYLSGYTYYHEYRMRLFLNNNWYNVSLTYWQGGHCYSFVALYMRYLIDQYGYGIVKDLCSTNRIGRDAVVNATGGIPFNDTFIDFTHALVLDGISTNPKHQFTSLDLSILQPLNTKGLYTNRTAAPYGGQMNIPAQPYSIQFVRWHGDFGLLYYGGSYNSIGSTVNTLRDLSRAYVFSFQPGVYR